MAPDFDAVVPRELRYGAVHNVDDVRNVVRNLIHHGATVIKLVATGAVFSSDGVPGAPELTEDQMRAAVEEASHYGVPAAAHAHGAEGVKRAVRAVRRSQRLGSRDSSQERRDDADAAQLLGWAGQVGVLAPGAFADLIAVEGDPLGDVTLLEHVRFVMKGGDVVRDDTTDR